MVLSMTGYGKGSTQFNEKEISVEIKSLNGKTKDLRMRLPANYREKEIPIRKMVFDHAIRGKVDLVLKLGGSNGEEDVTLNGALIRKLASELKDIKNDLSLDSADVLQSIMRIPNVVVPNDDEVSEDEWNAVIKAMQQALSNLEDFRKIEGEALDKDFRLRIKNILNLLEDTPQYEEARQDALKEKLTKNLNAFVKEENVDKNRYEQEIIYYLEKLDITEEKVRLAQHCHYFIETLEEENQEKGKKLTFISQEIGREINTLGAKAQFSDIQKIVVNMKDELEKIKEQLANII